MSKNFIIFNSMADETTINRVIDFCKTEGIPYDYQERYIISFQAEEIENVLDDGKEDNIY